MTGHQVLILAILAATVVMFLWGRWRHDMVALGALLSCVVAGVVPTGEAFAGFGHPAIIMVACILVLSNGLQSSGAIDILARQLLPKSVGPTATLAALTGLAATLSAFMNNVGALALLMPLAIKSASRHGQPPGRVLMPLAFGSMLGGMTTLIGTPPNLIVSDFRAQFGGAGFAMFDFSPVGLPVAVIGVAFLALIGWRLVPIRERAGAEGFETGAYLTEARVPETAKAAGMTLRDVEAALQEADAQVLGLIRNELRIPAPHTLSQVRAGDILVIEAEPKVLASALSSLDLKLEEDVREEKQKESEVQGEDRFSEGSLGNRDGDEKRVELENRSSTSAIQSKDIVLIELAVLPRADLAGRSASEIRLRTRYGINLLAVSRQGHRSMARLRTMPIKEGDVLLMQGPPDALAEFARRFGCVPLAERALRLPDTRQALTAAGIMAAATGGAAIGLAPAAITFAAGVLACVALRVIPTRRIYDAIDWPLIVLLGALIPVAEAMANTGAADVLARLLLRGVAQGSAVIALAVILVVTMTLTDFMNNAATAAVMCPIAIRTAQQLGATSDAFLMAVAIGASCAFLTPIGHQNNILILGPGGFEFGDYWRLGLPIEAIVVAVAIPMILVVWPL